uniref:Uncharacterized protein n=1 Tax=Arundo donax TaxID=35708 RepID=A0A0A9FVR7_ARUDO
MISVNDTSYFQVLVLKLKWYRDKDSSINLAQISCYGITSANAPDGPTQPLVT